MSILSNRAEYNSANCVITTQLLFYGSAHGANTVILIVVLPIVFGSADLGGVEKIEPLLTIHFHGQCLRHVACIRIIVWRNEVSLFQERPSEETASRNCRLFHPDSPGSVG